MGKKLFLILIICSSCSSIYRFSIDVQEPALVTLPVSAQNVLILNNTVAQNQNYGIERNFDGKSIRIDFPLSLDSMVWSAIDGISGVLNDSHFFNTVAIYQKSLRTDSDWLSKADLAPEIQSDFYNTENYDALFVINRLFFTVRENVKTIQLVFFSNEPIVFVDLRADVNISFSMYSPEKEKPLTTFTVSDSAFVKSTISGDSLFFFKEIPEYVLRELSHALGSRAAEHFIPMWKTQERTLFAGYGSRVQEATSYAANRQWGKAESLWITEIGKKTKPVDKAKIAFNLAVTNEMQDKFESALEWAQKAKEYLKNTNPNNTSKEIELTNQYISTLEKRIQNNRLLDLQWGKE
jgi:hypothetical protein